jgi:hypothetical protein
MQEGIGDLIEPLVNSGIISQQAYDHIVLKYDMYLQLWIVCVRAEKSVKAECERRGIRYPFQSPYELFLRIAQERGDYAFSLVLTDRGVSSRKLAKALRLLASDFKGESLDEEEKKLLKKVSPDTGCSLFWAHLVQNVASKAAKKSHLGRAFDCYSRVCVDVCRKQATLIGKGPSLKITRTGLVRGSRYGGTYEPSP